MAEAPLSVLTRPFAIEPVTRVMLPDGIFDNAIYGLDIACHLTNEGSAPLDDVSVYLESVGDPGIGFSGRTFRFPLLKPGASVLVSWRANFENASPGKTLVSFVARAAGMSARRSLQRIFVTQTRYDTIAKTWICTLPEGRLEVRRIAALKAGAEWCTPARDRERDPHDKKPTCPPLEGPRPITGITFVWVADPAFPGQHGELPFSDPWWKIVALVVAAVAALVGIIAAAAGAGTFSPGVAGKVEETAPGNPVVQCCTPHPTGTFENNATTVAGVAGTVCSVAIAVACSDEADPVWRGQENTSPEPGELTLAERVEAEWEFVEPPNAGVPYRTKVRWRYERVTTGQTYTYDVDEEQTNIHVSSKVTVKTPATVSFPDRLWVEVTFDRADGTPFRGPELYAFAVFRSPTDRTFLTRLGDDGLHGDRRPGDGLYYGFLDARLIERELSEFGEKPGGTWHVYVYAQDVNLVPPGTDPVTAAKTVGGAFIASAVTITFDPSAPCPLDAQATFEVV